MSYNEELQSNNSDLEDILATVNDLPEASSTSDTPVSGDYLPLAGGVMEGPITIKQGGAGIQLGTAGNICATDKYHGGGASRTVLGVGLNWATDKNTEDEATFGHPAFQAVLRGSKERPVYVQGGMTTSKVINEVALLSDLAVGYSSGLEYTLSEDGTYYICSGIGTCTDTDIKIPPSYKGLSVKIIGAQAFRACLNIVSVVIPGSVEKIDYAAFYNCRSLVRVIIGNSVTDICYDAFGYGCSALTDVVIPKSVTHIGDDAFYIYGSLKNVYYTGTKAEWQSITKDGDNVALSKATIHYDFVDDFTKVQKKLYEIINKITPGTSEYTAIPITIDNNTLLVDIAYIIGHENIYQDNYIQINGNVADNLKSVYKIRFEASDLENAEFKIYCYDVHNMLELVTDTAAIASVTFANYIAKNRPNTVPTIRFTSLHGNNDVGQSLLYSNEENPENDSSIKFTVEVVNGNLKEGDQVQICGMKLAKGSSANGYKSKMKLRQFVSHTITPQEQDKKFITIVAEPIKKVFAYLTHNNQSGNMNNTTTIYFRIRRPKGKLQENESGQTVTADFSNIIPVTISYVTSMFDKEAGELGAYIRTI